MKKRRRFKATESSLKRRVLEANSSEKGPNCNSLKPGGTTRIIFTFFKNTWTPGVSPDQFGLGSQTMPF